ncbi:MAG: DUF4271 domain-containing protein [Rikenellaceae bacterium]|nr:DUF4271 domain-containing protein [Rikenellaceae bacterium]
MNRIISSSMEAILNQNNVYLRDSSAMIPELIVPEILMTKNREAVFGTEAMPNYDIHYEGEAYEASRDQYYNSIIFSSLLFVLFIFSAYSVYRFRDQFPLLVKYFFSMRDPADIVEDQGVTFRYFVNTLNFIGFFASVAYVMKLIMIFYGAIGLSLVNLYDGYMILVATAALLTVFLYRFIIHKAVVLVAMDGRNIAELIFYNKIIFAFCTVLYMPFVLSFGYLGEQFTAYAQVILLWIPVIFMIYHGFKTYRFFIVRKFSIFQWFLYLCGVEILPISFFILSVSRGLELNF